MFNPETKSSRLVDSIPKRLHEALDRRRTNQEKNRAQKEARALFETLVMFHTPHERLYLPNGDDIKMTLLSEKATVTISRNSDLNLPLIVFSACWDTQNKTLESYSEFDNNGLLVGKVEKIESDYLPADEPRYRVTDHRKGIKDVDFDTIMQRRVYTKAADMFNLARNTLALQKRSI